MRTDAHNKRIANMIVAISYASRWLYSDNKALNNALSKERRAQDNRFKDLNKSLDKFRFKSLAYCHYDVPRLDIFPRLGDVSSNKPYTYTIEFRDYAFKLIHKPSEDYTLNSEIAKIIERFFGISVAEAKAEVKK